MPDSAYRLAELLLDWQEAYEAGDDRPAEAFCPDDPALCAELATQIELLRRMLDLHRTRHVEENIPAPVDHGRTTPSGGHPSTSGLPPGSEVAGHTILRELGRGGMGVVYLARQPGLNREVALKIVLSGVYAAPRELDRLRAEAEAIGKLQHPNIVQVYQVGEALGQPFVSLEYCAAGSLRGLTGTPWPQASAARLTETLARAVHAAHVARVVHRDLKPGNILLSAPLVPANVATAADPLPVKVADFGLAKDLDAAGDTPSGAAIGTPAYMAPEQASGNARAAGPAADVWALGVILYELLTGRPPLLGDTPVSTMLMVVNQEPVPPSRLGQKIGRDLEAVCLKCLEKSPTRRYPTSEALADDLRRVLDGRPTVVRPLGPVGRTGRWVRRHPGRAGLFGAVAVAAVLAALGGFAWWSERVWGEVERVRLLSRRAVEVGAQRRLTEAEHFHAGRSRVRERRIAALPGWTRQNLDELTALAATDDAEGHRPELRSEVAAALAGVELRRVGSVAAGEKWYDAAYSADGKTLAVGSRDAGPIHARVTVCLLDAATGATLRTLEAFVNPFDAAKGGRGPDGCRRLAFSPDGRWLAAGLRSGHLARWDLTIAADPGVVWNGHGRDTSDARYNAVDRLAFTADSRTLVSAGGMGYVRTWDAAGGWEQLATVYHPTSAYLPEADVYDPASIPCLATTLPQPPVLSSLDPRTGVVTRGEDGGIASRFAVSPSGNVLFIAAFGDHGPTLRNAALRGRSQPCLTPGLSSGDQRGHSCARFTPDGGLVVTGYEDSRQLGVWDVAAGLRAATLTLPDGGASSRVRIAPDGRGVAACEVDGIGLYEITGRIQRTVGITPERMLESASVSPDGAVMYVVTTGEGREEQPRLRMYHWRLSDRPSQLFRHVTEVHFATGPCSTDLNIHGEWAIGVNQHSRIIHQIFGDQPATSPVIGLRFAPGGLIWGYSNHTVRAFNSHDKKIQLMLANDFTAANRGDVFTALAVGQRVLVVGRRDGTLFRLDPAGGNATQEQLSDSAVTALALSADENAVAAGSAAGEVRILAGGAPPVVVAGAHGHEVTTAAFGPGYLVTGSRDGTVRLWRLTGEPILTLRFGGEVRKVMIPTSGRHLYAHVTGERGVRQWDMAELHRGLTAAGLDPGFPPPGG